ncbi:MAG: hypothetical protein CVU74_07720, partial [Deltaproteobacteria bacterium HGW-Deltaproteobacteria-9]
KKLIENPNFFQAVERKDSSRPLVVFDEIHKYKDWKNYLKGVYDQFHDRYQFLVSGSGRLDLYQKGGDSLAGRCAESLQRPDCRQYRNQNRSGERGDQGRNRRKMSEDSQSDWTTGSCCVFQFRPPRSQASPAS